MTANTRGMLEVIVRHGKKKAAYKPAISSVKGNELRCNVLDQHTLSMSKVLIGKERETVVLASLGGRGQTLQKN